jgi:hypothetical protein
MRAASVKSLILIFEILFIIEMFFIAGNCYANGKKEKEQSMFSAVEGNLKLYVHKGEHVKKGQLLYYVASNELFPAEQLGAKRDVEIDKINYFRQKRLSKTGSVSEQKLEDALKRLRDDTDKMEYYGSAVKHGHYYSPYNAIITKIYFPNGSGMGDGSRVMSLVKI